MKMALITAGRPGSQWPPCKARSTSGSRSVFTRSPTFGRYVSEAVTGACFAQSPANITVKKTNRYALLCDANKTTWLSGDSSISHVWLNFAWYEVSHTKSSVRNLKSLVTKIVDVLRFAAEKYHISKALTKYVLLKCKKAVATQLQNKYSVFPVQLIWCSQPFHVFNVVPTNSRLKIKNAALKTICLPILVIFLIEND